MSIEVYPARTKIYCPMLQKEIVDNYCVQCDNYNGHKINSIAKAFYIECMHERGIKEVRANRESTQEITFLITPESPYGWIV